MCKLPVHAVRWTDENKRIEEGYHIRVNQLNLVSAFVYQVENSDFIEWLNKESLHLYEHLNLQHFVLFTCEDIIDVICEEEPIIFTTPAAVE